MAHNFLRFLSRLRPLCVAAGGFFIALPCFSQAKPDCSALPDATRLRGVLQSIVKQGSEKNGGLGNQEWAAVVNRDGIVCAIVFSGTTRGDQWPGSRLIAAEKANTANGLSGNNYALSTANVFAAAQPGQSLYSLATSAPPNPNAVFGEAVSFGTPNDPMVGKAVGGIIVFGGGLALYSPQGKIVGGLGLSGDTSCTDHVIAWKVRHELHLDAVPMGPSPDHNDNMIIDWKNNSSASGFGHPPCKGGSPAEYIIGNLSKDFPDRSSITLDRRNVTMARSFPRFFESTFISGATRGGGTLSRVWLGLAGRRNALARNDRWGRGRCAGHAFLAPGSQVAAETLIQLHWKDVAQGWRIPWYMVCDTWVVTLVFFSDLLHLRPAGSYYRVCGFKCSKRDPAILGRGVLATIYMTATPNSIVLGIDPTVEQDAVSPA